MRIPSMMYNATCSLYLYSGPTARGDGFGSEIPNVKCRVELKVEKKVTNKEGSVVEYISKGTGFIDNEEILEGSKIVYKGNDYIVAASEPQYGFKFSHTEVILR